MRAPDDLLLLPVSREQIFPPMMVVRFIQTALQCAVRGMNGALFSPAPLHRRRDASYTLARSSREKLVCIIGFFHLVDYQLLVLTPSPPPSFSSSYSYSSLGLGLSLTKTGVEKFFRAENAMSGRDTTIDRAPRTTLFDLSFIYYLTAL